MQMYFCTQAQSLAFKDMEVVFNSDYFRIFERKTPKIHTQRNPQTIVYESHLEVPLL